MKERPILFSGPMVRAIMEGRKTQTRRVINPPAPFVSTDEGLDVEWAIGNIHCPYGVPGDRLWMRETHYVQSAGYKDGSGTLILYRATEPNAPNTWTPSIHMPRWASRITLEITDVRVQRVQEISKKDAKEEGIRYLPEAHSWSSDEEYQGLGRLMTPISAFAELWDSINAKKYSWASNPWVWAITFRRIDLPA